jgi:hypothetical protein
VNLPKKTGEMTSTEQDRHIARLKNEATIPLLETLAEELSHRARSGELAEEFHGEKASKLINSLSKILTALQTRGPVVIVPPAAVGDGKDPSWFRANSATNLTEAERRKRREAVDAEVVEDK